MPLSCSQNGDVQHQPPYIQVLKETETLLCTQLDYKLATSSNAIGYRKYLLKSNQSQFFRVKALKISKCLAFSFQNGVAETRWNMEENATIDPEKKQQSWAWKSINTKENTTEHSFPWETRNQVIQ